MRGLTRKPCVAQPGQGGSVVGQVEPLTVADRVAPKAERPRRGHGRVELADGPGGRVARVGERRLPVGGALLVEACEGGQRQVDLAAHLDHRRRRRAQAQR